MVTIQLQSGRPRRDRQTVRDLYMAPRPIRVVQQVGHRYVQGLGIPPERTNAGALRRPIRTADPRAGVEQRHGHRCRDSALSATPVALSCAMRRRPAAQTMPRRTGGSAGTGPRLRHRSKPHGFGDQELHGPALRSRSATAAGPRPARDIRLRPSAVMRGWRSLGDALSRCAGQAALRANVGLPAGTLPAPGPATFPG
jgi:hypothetical protein